MKNSIRAKLGALLTVLILLMGAFPASASVWSDDDDYNKVYNEAQLRQVLNRANANDTIRVRNTIRLSDPIHIKGGKNFTISGDPIQWDGGAGTRHGTMIVVESGATLRLKDITVDGNGEIGVIYVNSGGTLYMESGSVVKKGYTPKVGGGVYNAGTFYMDSGTLYNCVSGQDGGGVYNLGALLIEHGIISDNKAETGNGGGVYNDGTLGMNGGKIGDNTAGGDGGGVYHSTAAKKFELGGEPVISDGFYLAKKQTITLSASRFDLGSKVRLEGVEDPAEWRVIATGAGDEHLRGFVVKQDLLWQLEKRSNTIVMAYIDERPDSSRVR